MTSVVVVTRFQVPEGDLTFAALARRAVAVLAQRPGYRGARLGRAADDPTAWILSTEWEGVGAWRRALSAYDVRVEVVPLFARAIDEPGAFEVLLNHTAEDTGPDGTVQVQVPVLAPSDRAPDAGTTGPGRLTAAPPL